MMWILQYLITQSVSIFHYKLYINQMFIFPILLEHQTELTVPDEGPVQNSITFNPVEDSVSAWRLIGTF